MKAISGRRTPKPPKGGLRGRQHQWYCSNEASKHFDKRIFVVISRDVLKINEPSIIRV
jgi:hypothetical protein